MFKNDVGDINLSFLELVLVYRLILIDFVYLRVGPLKNKMALESKSGWLRLVYPCDQHESKSSNNIPSMIMAPQF